jgi:hypothetical protein
MSENYTPEERATITAFFEDFKAMFPEAKASSLMLVLFQETEDAVGTRLYVEHEEADERLLEIAREDNQSFKRVAHKLSLPTLAAQRSSKAVSKAAEKAFDEGQLVKSAFEALAS